ncbi:hypothetical protein Tco_0260610 [Tanacetum coccineum]
MANLSEDIQCAGSDTRLPMLDRTDFASWKQCIQLYYQGKENGVNILKSIDEGPFQMGTFWETVVEGTKGAPHLVKLNRGLRDSNYDQLYAYLKQHKAHANENKMMLDRFTQHTMDPLDLMSNVLHQQHYLQSSTTPPSTYVPPYFADNTQLDSGLSSTNNLIENLTNALALLTQSYKTYLPQTNNQLRTSSNTRNQATVQDRRVVNRVGNANPSQARQIKCYNCNDICYINGVALDEEQLLFIAGGQDNAIDEDVDEQPVQDLALNVDNVFQADDCDAFDSDVDEAPTAQTMFMANLSSADPVYDEAGPSYDSDILSEVHDHDHYQDAVCEHHEEHEMHDDVQPNYVVDSHANYTSDSNMIPYDQYVKDNAVPVVQSNVSSVPNDAYMMIFNDMHEPHAQSVSDTTRNTVVDNSLTAELATYKEQVELYERRASAHTEDTLEIAEITRRKMNNKMKDPECVTHKVKIAPPNYSKENYLATFTPQKQLTPEQIFWSQDLIKIKEEALKKQTTASRPIKALMVYPLNTPAMLVPRMLPTKSQVKINIFALIQLFSEFKKPIKRELHQ